MALAAICKQIFFCFSAICSKMGSTTDLSYSERVLEDVQTAVSSKTYYVRSPKLDISHGLVVSFCDHRVSVVCQQITFSPKPLKGISPNLTGMIYGWSPLKLGQNFPFYAEFWQ